MNLLFDASSIFELIKVKGPDSLHHVKGNYTISLVHYELGNILWKYSRYSEITYKIIRGIC
jgi:hypothetical protein